MHHPLNLHIILNLAFALFVSLGTSIAQILPDQVFTTHDGIPQIQVQHIALDSRGVCWINTKGGLAYFDGEYVTEQKNKNGESFSNGSIVMPAGNSIIFNSGNHLIKYNGSSMDTLYSDIYSRYKDRVIYHNDLLHLIAHDKQKLLLINLEGKIIDSTELINFRSQISLDGPNVFINHKNPNTNTYHVYMFINRSLSEVYTSKNAIRLSTHQSNTRFVEHHVNKNKTTFYLLNHRNNFARFIRFGKDQNGVFKIKKLGPILNNTWWTNDNILYKIIDDDVKQYKISNNTYVHVVEDKDENILVSNEHGLTIFLNHNFTTYPLDFINDVWTIHKHKNQYFTSHFSKGVFKVDFDNQTKKYIPFEREQFRMYFGSSNSDNIIFFPASKGFSLLENGKRTDYRDIENISELLTSYYDPAEKTFFAGGLNSLLIYNNQKKKYNTVNDTSSSAPGYIVELKPKNNQETWCGYWSGLKLFNKTENRFSDMSHLFPMYVEPSASSLAYDHKGRLWVGGKNGLFIQKLNSDTLEVVSDIFNGKQILDIEFIPSRKIFAVGTNSEIYFVDISTGLDPVVIKEFNYKNGFQGEEIAQNGFYLDGNDLWIPSATYLSKIDVANISLKTPYSTIFIKSINDQFISFNPSNKDPIEIEKGRNNFQIDFGSIGTGLPLKRSYQYKLEGYDNKWSKWSSDEKVNYQNLGSGEYDFLLRGKKSNGVDITEARTAILIDLPLHKEPSFYKFALLGLLLFFLASIAYFYFYRRLSILNKEKELTNNYLKVKGLQSQMKPHFIFNVLGSIQSLMLNGKIDEADKYLIAFSKLIRRFLDSSLPSDSEAQIESELKETSLADEIELLEIYTRFEEIQLDNKFSTTIDVNHNIDLEMETIPPMIIQPFVENAIKHGLSPSEEKGKLNIRFTSFNDVMTCIIDDNGIGRRKAEDLKKNK